MKLPHLLGNERLKAALNSLPSGGLGSAVLLDGPDGVGKRTAAMDIAMGLLCTGPDAPCGLCPACRRVAAGTHPDLQLLQEADKGVRLEQVRELRAKTFLRPSEADFKVFIIEQADKLNVPSQNALLKVLEEPANCVFLLLCENREAVLQTVRSRCVPFRLTPLSPALLQSELQKRTDAPQEQQRQAAALSGGVLGRALALLAEEDAGALSAARQFCAALQQDELTVFSACQGLTRLSREEYAVFCDEACRLLTEHVAQTGSSHEIHIFEYLEKQRDMLAQNPSVSALAGALTAFCAVC